MQSSITVRRPANADFAISPLLVFYELTRACDLICLHCRACAQRNPAPDELSTWSARALIDEIASFPVLPLLVLTGGDPFKRKDLAELVWHATQRKLEVAILLALEPQIFMFDEPTAGMSVDEVPVILDLIRSIKAQGDKTVLLVEHKMDVVRSLSDRIVVLHNGKLVADGEPAKVIASPIVQQAYLGMGSGDE